MNGPCKGCEKPKRYSGCHDHCAEYKAYKAEIDRIREAQQKERQTINALHGIRSHGVEKARRFHSMKQIRYK